MYARVSMLFGFPPYASNHCGVVGRVGKEGEGKQ